ncbi:MAG: type II secretion system F family protein [Furfurilactobacillus sp.]|uniref:type II secretion system F family protein n=1 Tax=Furfurilactobacillus TaxID=2767882 RepID=UPI001F398D16|nr:MULTISPECIES: type II secretion system F family protein [Furfurilactobacillus]MCF6420575.1 type II secretion system F family protein [Furfurilactobacillus milii]MCH4011086.1 type II secretion system F family protein [Furfurilactobacillus sp.]MCH4036978.1 type II secretion system F family protein [Furfurilactobacillus sp.]MCH4114076.1 type II secretion system F family protein [Furfurilactobacillus sp.]MCH4134222.1 type II secretion system F family protein [Furfurilactobacillus sp.]
MMRSEKQLTTVWWPLRWLKVIRLTSWRNREALRKLSGPQTAQLFSLMADVLTAGFSLREGLNFARVMLPKMHQTIADIQNRLAQGIQFAEAMRPFVSVDCFYQIKIAEENGELISVLTNLGNFLAVKVRQQQKIRAVLRYPLCILICLGLLIVAVKQLLLPELSGLGAKQLLIPSIGWPLKVCLIVFITGIIIVGWRFWHLPRLRQLQVSCKLPIVGPLLKMYWHYYLSLNLSLLLNSGMQSHDVMKLLQTYEAKSLLRQLADQLNDHLLEGAKLATFIDRYRFIPATFKVFFNKGLSSREIAKDLKVDAQLTYHRLFNRIEGLIGLIQPLLFGVIGLGIVGVYLSILLPLYHTIGGLS